MNNTINPDHYKTLTFDCYGTLIDWESGILGYLQPMLQSYYVNVIDEYVLGLFAELEPRCQAEGGSYREVLGHVCQGFATRLGFTLPPENLGGLADSIEFWQPFPDTRGALDRLSQHFDLAVISNVDDDLFEYSRDLLGFGFSHVTTAQAVGKYKPDPEMFNHALAAVEGPVLHVAQSRYHDIEPASQLGLDTVWINRSGDGAASGITAEPTWTFASLEEFAQAVGTR